MKWVYILQCDNGYFYVGETSRLYRRIWEHENGMGGLNTYIHAPEKIVAIYPVHRLNKFFDYINLIKSKKYNIYFDRRIRFMENFNNDEDEYYDSLMVENNITEKMMLDNQENWKKIRGGKYVRFDVEYKFPHNNFVKELPNCYCGFPCDVKQNEENNFLYFRCAKKNMWEQMRQVFDIDDKPCDFFMKYKNNSEYESEYEKLKLKVKMLTSKSDWLKNLIDGHYEFCVGGCGKEYDEDNTVRYSRKAINLCFDCFIEKNEQLAKKYNQDNSSGKCLITIEELI